jgi:hypothetical protein
MLVMGHNGFEHLDTAEIFRAGRRSETKEVFHSKTGDPDQIISQSSKRLMFFQTPYQSTAVSNQLTVGVYKDNKLEIWVRSGTEWYRVYQ